ncbi:hypothetical protein AM499_04705 [Bacillus sp. FJAT-22090]|uniref:hypothetical protein n=1 Tax=Bacillus sp. FJAT-22090 TaxID=1581038 RepID=UPI0006AF3210|nr:hypothetical protein [Bacillus sp. FJAT-22090]ALC85194.1 hypothetical protein AM499_04705 [Bacillus sp. FJAT-22090]
MLISIGILVISTAIFLIEIPNLLKNGYTKDIWIFSILLLFGTGLSIAMAFQVKLSNPLDWVTYVYRPFSDFIMSTFK